MKTSTSNRTKPTPNTRPFENDYAGAWRGHCKSRESAITAAQKHCVQDGYRACTISENGLPVAWVTYDYRAKTVTIKTATHMALPVRPSLRRIK